MNIAKVLLIFLAVIVVGVLIVGGCAYHGYNRAISLDEQVNNAWAEVENQLKRRYDLVPNLVETVKGYASQEKEIFLGVANARKAYFQANTRPEQMKASQGLERALSRLLVLREQYPELKSNESFMKLQDSLEGTENRIAVARRRYNTDVKALNTFTRTLLGRLYSSLAGVKPAEYFHVEEAEQQAPKVNFSTNANSG
jgi:LemA protein